ncbi:hypothetical protein CL634_00280 [bacterium]|nr:hypothetical protein [bacterium]
MPAKDQVIVVNHVQQFKEGDTASRFLLGLYKYYKDKSLRHILQHYVDIAAQPGRLITSQIADVYYNEEEKRFCITYDKEAGMAFKTCIMAEVRDLYCVTALPLAPFKPRSPEEAELMKKGNNNE